MANEIPGLQVTKRAGADLSALQFQFVKLNASGDVVAIAAVTDMPFGILQNAPGSGKPANVMLMGVSKIKTSAAVAINAAVGPAADGRGVTKTIGTDTTNYAPGICVEATGAANGIGSIAFSCLPPGRAS